MRDLLAKIPRPKHLPLYAFLLLVIVYFVALQRNLHESERRSLQIKAADLPGDYIKIFANTFAVDAQTGQITLRLSFRFFGRIARDNLTPNTDLQFSINSSRGQQTYKLAKNS